MTVNRKLQIKFTVITMIAVTIIIIGVFGVVTYENYEMTNNQLDAIESFKTATLRSIYLTRGLTCFNTSYTCACFKKNIKSYF